MKKLRNIFIIGYAWLIFMFVAGLYGLYWFGLSGFEYKPKPQKSISLPENVYNSFWSLEEKSKTIEFESTSPIKFILKILDALMDSGAQNSDFIKLHNGYFVASDLASHFRQRNRNYKKIHRHIAQLSLMIWISNNWSAREAISKLANITYFGRGHYGIQNAAYGYFRKEVMDLTVCESATLSILRIAPSRYGNNKEGATSRRNKLLKDMVKLGFISDAQYKSCLNKNAF